MHSCVCLRRNLNHVWIQFHRSVSSPCVWVFVKVQCDFRHFCSGSATFTSRFAVSWGRGRENGEGLVARGHREGSHGTRNGNEKTKNLHIHCKKGQIHKLRIYRKTANPLWLWLLIFIVALKFSSKIINMWAIRNHQACHCLV